MYYNENTTGGAGMTKIILKSLDDPVNGRAPRYCAAQNEFGCGPNNIEKGIQPFRRKQ